MTEERMGEWAFDQILIDDKQNARTSFDGVVNYDKLQELAESIKKDGLHQPVLLRYKWEDEHIDKPYVLVAGFCRAHCVRDILKQPTIKGLLKPLDRAETIAANLTENLQRAGINIMQESESLRMLMRMGITGDEDLAKRLNVSKGWLQPRKFLLKMDIAIQKIAREGFLTYQQVRDLYTLQDPEEQLRAAVQIKLQKQKRELKGSKINVFDHTSKGKAIQANIKRARKKTEIENLLMYLASIECPFGIHTEMLGWAAGNVSDVEILATVQTFMAEKDIAFYPEGCIPSMNALTHG